MASTVDVAGVAIVAATEEASEGVPATALTVGAEGTQHKSTSYVHN